jgi:hypothetical protein
MKTIQYFLVIGLFACQVCLAQPARTPKVGWFVAPEGSALLLGDHVGKAVGVQFGLRFFGDHLKVGYYMYGRSGPLNAQVFPTDLPNGITYKGQSRVNLKADHGAFGLLVAPSFRLPGSRVEVDIPLMMGLLGGGFYLAGPDRNTPDGRRVSQWENQLFEGKDADFAPTLEAGIRALVPTRNPAIKWGLGLHYVTTQGWETYYDPTGDFYNNKLRASLLVQFGSHRR